MALTILILSLIPKPPIVMEGFRLFDKTAHFVSYLFLAALGFLSQKADRGLKPLVVTVVGCSLYGGLIELLQYFTPRQTDIWDFAANVAGSLFGSLAGLVFHRLLFRRYSDKPHTES